MEINPLAPEVPTEHLVYRWAVDTLTAYILQSQGLVNQRWRGTDAMWGRAMELQEGFNQRQDINPSHTQHLRLVLIATQKAHEAVLQVTPSKDDIRLHIPERFKNVEQYPEEFWVHVAEYYESRDVEAMANS